MIKQEWAYLRKNKILLLVFLAIIAIPTIYTTLFLSLIHIYTSLL